MYAAFLFFLLVLTQTASAYVSFKPHNQTKIEGSLEYAQFCENLPVGEVIYRLSATGGTGSYRFYLSGDLANYVSLNADTGELTLTKPFDRESQSSGLINAEVEVRDSGDGTEDSKTTKVVIDDANDNVPVIEPIRFAENIYEWPWTPSILANVSVTDADSSTAGAVRLFVEGTDMIYVESSFSSDSRLLYNTSIKLDYDTTPVIFATLIAKDGGRASCNSNVTLSTNQSLLLQVQDGPDQPPLFTVTLGNVKINENEPEGAVLGQVEARDRDYRLDWDVEYEVVGDGRSEEFFAVDPRNGTVTLKRSIDRESLDSDSSGIYRFNIRATEIVPDEDPFKSKQALVGYPFSTNTSVTVTIVDQDDNLPTFYKLNDTSSLDEKFATNFFSTTIDEGLSMGSVVQGLNIYVEDIDQDLNAEFDVEILEPDCPFQLTPNRISGSSVLNVAVKSSQMIDFDVKPNSFNFTIVATSRREEAAGDELSRASVRIELRDTNDNSPVFDRSVLYFAVPENSPPGTWVGKLNATDLDSGIFGEVTYGILLGSEGFQVTSDGNVTVRSAVLDRETIPTYYVTFVASDGGNRTAIVPAEITLTDVNDNAPETLRDIYYATMLDEDNSTEVIIQATDLDEGENGNITFTISPNEFSEYFSIAKVENQGVLRPVKALDIEAMAGTCEGGDKIVSLVVVVADRGIPSLNKSVDVEISLQDVNEFAPTFNSTNPLRAEVKEKSDLGTEIARITAYDIDACSPNNEVDFTISGDNSLRFLITKSDDGSYGSLQVRNSALDRDVQATYDVTVVATDLGSPRRLSSSYNVTVVLLDANDKPPRFNQSTLVDAAVPEDASLDTLVREVIASDSDETSSLSYNITGVECFNDKGVIVSGCQDWFVIVTRTKGDVQEGEVRVAEKLDRELAQQVRITVTVEDLNSETGFKQVAAAVLTISLEDVNDQAPVFEAFDNYEVNEESNNTRVGQIRAIDNDLGVNSEIVYSVADDFKDFIQINPTTGEFGTSKALDRETMGEFYNVTFIAADGGSPSMRSNASVSIRIRDTNDHAPRISDLPRNITLREDAAVDTEIYTVLASDVDEGRNAELSFSIEETNLPFDINRDTGVLQLVSHLDYERTTSYKITIKVSDNGIPSLSSTGILYLYVEDTNDNPPRFTEDAKPQLLTIAEGPPRLTGLFIQEAFDDDSVGLQTNFYYVAGGDGASKFDVDPTSREIRTVSEIDREERDSYEIVVQVSDVENLIVGSDLSCHDVTVNDTFTCVYITVGDVNDQAPVFSKDEFISDIGAETQPNAKVPIAQVYASDGDVGENAVMTYSITRQQRCCSTCLDQGEIFTIDSDSGDVYLVQSVTLENECFFTIQVRVTDGLSEHTDDSVLKIGVIKDDQTVKLLSTFSPSDFTTEKRSSFEEELGELMNATVIIDKVLPTTSDINSAIQSQLTFHAKLTGTNDLVQTSEIDTILDSGQPDVDVFLAKYGIKGRSVTVVRREDKSLQVAFIATSAVLLLVCVVLVIAVVCMRQRMNRNKRVERAMEQTYEDLEIHAKSGVANNYKTNENPLYDISDNQPTLDIDNPYDSTDDLDDAIDDNAIDNSDSAIINDELNSSCESVCGDFQIDFSQPGADPSIADNKDLAKELNDAISKDLNIAFEDTNF